MVEAEVNCGELIVDLKNIQLLNPILQQANES